MDRLPRGNSTSKNPFWMNLRSPRGAAARHRQPQPEQAVSPPRPILVKPVPIHERPLAVNPQNDCPLFNGRIPPEIRDSIFEYALTEYTKTDPSSIYSVSTNYTRPGYTGKRTITTALLQACRRVYLETYHLPPVSKEHVFWHGRSPPHADAFAMSREDYYFQRLTSWQIALVKEVHLFTQLYWLEGSFPHLCSQQFMQGIEKLKITIRRGDWWWNENNAPLGINPQRGNGESSQMRRDWAAEKAGRVLPWNPSGWGCAFAKLKGLKELEIELETSDDKKDELMAIVENAKTWRFPFGENLVLSTEGTPISTSMWQGPMCYWSDRCPYCGEQRTAKCKKVEPPRKGCEERMRWRAEEKGPICHVVSLRWKVVSATGGR